MSLEIREGLVVKTDRDYSKPVGQLVFLTLWDTELVRQREEESMETVTDELRSILLDESVGSDPTLRSFRKYLKSMYPKTIKSLDGNRIVLSPNLRWTYPPDEYEGPEFYIMGTKLRGVDLIFFTEYVLTNTDLETNDPRIRLLDTLRGDVDDI